MPALLLGCSLLPGCRHTPSYNDIKVERGGGLANANSAIPAAGRSIGSENPPTPDNALSPLPEPSPPPDASASPSPTSSYFDQKTGQIKNLPLFPGAKVRRVQYGPINGTPQVTLQAVTRAPFETVTAFYDKVVKDNRWTIDDNSRDANSSVWQLSRGQTERAAIRVDRAQPGRVTISLARTI